MFMGEVRGLRFR